MSNGAYGSWRVPGAAQPELPAAISVNISEGDAKPTYDPASGTTSFELGDGSVAINLNPDVGEVHDEDFDSNLAIGMDPGELNRLSEEILRGVEADEQSRQVWLNTRARGIDLLGLKLEAPRTDVGSAPLEGMSTVRHPLLLEATLRFQSNARGELLPANGPVKVRDDSDEGSTEPGDELAAALEIDMNHYLTVDAPEYYPDTDRMLFSVGFGGCGFKKVYTCPIRNRPVSESVDAKDIIVSDAVTDLRNAGRVTQRIMMRPSTLKRMQLVGAYRKVDLHYQQVPNKNVVDLKIADIQGITPQNSRPEDQDCEILETYVELNLRGYEHKDKGEQTGLPLPYRVAIEKQSRQILEIRRNWEEGDDLCLPLVCFVKFPFVSAFGFYDIGLVHILGNSTVALTAAWREMLDAGMFASFPGFLYSRSMARQETNEFRVAPGSGMPIDTGGQSIQDTIMPLPYRDASPGLLQLTESITQQSERLGGTAEMNVGEGSQEAPVGTTLALIEQATKVMDAVHKRLHAAQSEEFRLLKREFKKDPEALWRVNPKSRVRASLGFSSKTNDDPQYEQKLAKFTAALNNCNLVPAADPNTPSEMHRLMKAMALIQLMQMSQELPDGRLDPRKVIEHALRTIRVGGDMFAAPNTGGSAPPDPKVVAAMIQQQGSQDKVQIAQIQSGDKQRELASKERIAQADLMRDTDANKSNVTQSLIDFQREEAANQSNIHQAVIDAGKEKIKAQASNYAADKQVEAEKHAAKTEGARASTEKARAQTEGRKAVTEQHKGNTALAKADAAVKTAEASAIKQKASNGKSKK